MLEQDQSQEKKSTNVEDKYKSIIGFTHVSTAVNKANHLIHQYRTGQKRPLLTFSGKLNNKIEGLYPGDQVVIAARLGVGKSSVANILLRSLKDNNPWAKLLFLYWSLEMPAYQQIVRMYSHDLKMPVKGILNSRQPIEEGLWNSLKSIGEGLKDYNIYFREAPVNSAEWEEAVYNVQAQFPDHTIVNIFDHTRLIAKGNEASEEQKISNLMYSGIVVKNKIDCINIFLSQMNRNIENANNGDRRDVGATAPMVSDIFGSDAVGQFATIIIALHRPELYNKTTYSFAGATIDARNLIACHVLKQRDGWTGLITWEHNLAHNDVYDRPIERVQT